MDYSRIQDLQDAYPEDPWSANSTSSTDGQLAFFRIYDVDADHRTCSIKTFGTDSSVSNGNYLGVQWLGFYSNSEGDEISYVPRLDSYGICVFLGGQPYIIGYISPLTMDSSEPIIDLENEGVVSQGSSAAVNKEKINVGDYILRTIGRCRLVLRAGGEIELEATKTCRRTYFPSRNRITEISQNLEIYTDGGSVEWVHLDQDANSEETICTRIWRDTVQSTNIIQDERGTVEKGKDIIHRFQIKGGSNVNEHLSDLDKPTYLREISNTGKTVFKINDTAFNEIILADGAYTRAVGKNKHLFEIKPSGECHLNINQKYDNVIKETGETSVNIADKFKLNILPSGETTLNVADKCSINISASGDTVLNIGPDKSTITISPAGEVVIKSATSVSCETETVELKSSFVKLGKSVSDVVPMGKILVKAINKFIANYKTHYHTGNYGAPTSPPEGDTTKAIIETAVLSETVKVQK